MLVRDRQGHSPRKMQICRTREPSNTVFPLAYLKHAHSILRQHASNLSMPNVEAISQGASSDSLLTELPPCSWRAELLLLSSNTLFEALGVEEDSRLATESDVLLPRPPKRVRSVRVKIKQKRKLPPITDLPDSESSPPE
jgi:hypothetical protein